MEDPTLIEYGVGFKEQLNNLLKAIKLSKQHVKKLRVIYSDLENVLQEIWPGCKARPFGSLVTGLAVKFSDADCFMEIPEKFRKGENNFVEQAEKVLLKHPELFEAIRAVPNANTPIVKFIHVGTATCGDLTFKTLLGVKNSELIAFLIESDPRILPLAIVIKYWARVQGISGTKLLTNHTLMLMLIFYLQQLPVKILPSIEYMQRRCKKDMVDFWNTGYNKRVLPLKCKNKTTVHDLLGGFFEYYANFNFSINVICPFLGKPLKRYFFNELDTLPDSLALYKENVRANNTNALDKNTPFCVQDPFEQCHNVAVCISERTGFEIRSNFKFAFEIYLKEKSENCDNFIKDILIEKPDLTNKKLHECRIKLYWHLLNRCTSNRARWQSIVRSNVVYIFEEMLQIKLNEVNQRDNRPTDQDKFYATVMRPVWKRKQFLKNYRDSTIDLLKRQELVTLDILRSYSFDLNLRISVTIYYGRESNGPNIVIRFSTGNIDDFRLLHRLLKCQMFDWFVALLRDEYDQ